MINRQIFNLEKGVKKRKKGDNLTVFLKVTFNEPDPILH